MATTTNGQNPPGDPDRDWMLRALRGDITSEAAYAIVRNTRHLWHNNQLLKDPEAIAALNVGDNKHLDDPKRFEPLDETWTAPYVTYDSDTEAAFDEIASRPDFADGYEPHDDGWDTYEQPAGSRDFQIFTDWAEFWANEEDTAEWLLEDVIARGRGHAIYAMHKQGKSLFLLWVAALLATTNPDLDVIYLDYEMSRADIRERLEDMGYGPDSDLTRLHYAFAPAIHPLDSPTGAGELAKIIDQTTDPTRHLVVFIDTFGRAVEGEENSNDTTRAFYRWTGAMLRQRHATWARLDHAGKDQTKGQRGGSAKGDDVDIIWKLTRQDNGIRLHRDNARMSWVPETVTYTIGADPLTYTRNGLTVPAGTADCITHCDELALPRDISIRKARAALKEAGYPTRTEAVTAALRHRRDRVQTFDLGAGNTLIETGNT